MTRIILPWPSPKLSPNARNHWAIKNDAVKGARQTAFYIAKQAGVPVLPPEGDIRLLVTFLPPDKHRRDSDNLVASMKAGMDGIADAWGVDDSRFEPTYRRGDPVRGGLVTVELVAP